MPLHQAKPLTHLWQEVLVPTLHLRPETHKLLLHPLGDTNWLQTQFLSLQKHRIRVNKLLHQVLLVQLLQDQPVQRMQQLRNLKMMVQELLSLDKTRLL